MNESFWRYGREPRLISSQMFETIISELSAEHRNEFHVVRLNGFVHTDDKLALKDIWRQLGREMELEDDVANKVGFPSP